MSFSKYASTFIEKMKLDSHLVPTKLSKIEKFVNGLPTNYGPTVKLETTLKAAMWAAKNLEIHIRDKGVEKARNWEKGSLKDLQFLINNVGFQILSLRTRSMGVTTRRSGVKTTRRSILGDMMKW